MKEMKIYPSSAAWACGGLVITEQPSGCLRNLLWKHVAEIPEDLPQELKDMGAAGERKYENYLQTQQEHPYHVEKPFRSQILGITVSGRMDFVVHHDGYSTIRECKTSKSSKVLYDVIRAGVPKVNHVAQVVMYFIHTGMNRGILVYNYWPKQLVREFKLSVNDKGVILVDGKPYTHTIDEQLAHQTLSAKVLTDKTVMGRPASDSACRYCIYKDRCEAFDQWGGTQQEFIQQLQGDSNEHERSIPSAV